MSAIKKLGFLSSGKTLFLLCDVQEKFRFMNYFADFSKNINKVVSICLNFTITKQVFLRRLQLCLLLAESRENFRHSIDRH